MFTNFDDVVCNEHNALELLSLWHVERCSTAFLGTPASADERVTYNDVVLIVARVDVQRRVARPEARAHTQIH